MEYFLGAIVGILYGGIVCLIKYFCLWRPYIKPRPGRTVNDGSVYARMGISYGINVVALLVIYLLRDVPPESVNWVALIIATAVSMSLFGKFYSIDKINKKSAQ